MQDTLLKSCYNYGRDVGVVVGLEIVVVEVEVLLATAFFLDVLPSRADDVQDLFDLVDQGLDTFPPMIFSPKHRLEVFYTGPMRPQENSLVFDMMACPFVNPDEYWKSVSIMCVGDRRL